LVDAGDLPFGGNDIVAREKLIQTRTVIGLTQNVAVNAQQFRSVGLGERTLGPGLADLVGALVALSRSHQRFAQPDHADSTHRRAISEPLNHGPRIQILRHRLLGVRQQRVLARPIGMKLQERVDVVETRTRAGIHQAEPFDNESRSAAAAFAGADGAGGAGAITEAGIGVAVSDRGGTTADAPWTTPPSGRAAGGASESGMGAIMRTPGMLGASKTAPLLDGTSIVEGARAGAVTGANASAGADSDAAGATSCV